MNQYRKLNPTHNTTSESKSNIQPRPAKFDAYAYGGSIIAHSKTCSYCKAAWSHEISCSMPRRIIPSHDSLCSRKVSIDVLNT